MDLDLSYSSLGCASARLCEQVIPDSCKQQSPHRVGLTLGEVRSGSGIHMSVNWRYPWIL